MIQVSVLTQKGLYKKITVTGHAESGNPGFDLVCAGVSSVMTGSLNGFDTLAEAVSLTLTEEPRVEIDLNNTNTLNQKLFEFMLIQLKTIEHMYSEYIDINEKEVIS